MKGRLQVRRIALALLVSICTFGLSLFAQDRAAIVGVVTDSSGSVIPEAKVELDSSTIGFHRTTVTSPDGLIN
jgi:hypothetical protein